ncbi:MAG: transaldolase [Candidatus Krumholzibacteriia bacterium]
MQVQTWGESVSEMTECGEQLAGLHSMSTSIVIKVPATETGFQVAKHLKAKGHRVTMTAVYTTGQVLLAAGFEAAYAAPYLNRLIDAGQPGREIVLTMDRILAGSAAPTRLLVASLRSAQQVLDLAERGLDTFTFGPQVAAELLSSDLTTAAAQEFQEAADEMGRE